MLGTFVAMIAIGGKIELPPAPRLENPVIEADHVCLEPVTVPMVFPVEGRCDWSDTFLAPRVGHRHQGQDLMASKMTRLVACFDGTVTLHRPKVPGGHIYLTLKGDNGWTAQYMHINNDTPGTDDGSGLDENAFAPGLETGQHVEAGQFIAFVGDSGNAEDTSPHCHFELWETGTHACVNATESLRNALKTAPQPASRHSTRTAKRTASPKPASGTEWEGQVLAVDVQTRRVKIALECARTPGLPADLRRRDVWVTIDPKASVFLASDTGYDFELTDLMEGFYARMTVTVSSTGARVTRMAVTR